MLMLMWMWKYLKPLPSRGQRPAAHYLLHLVKRGSKSIYLRGSLELEVGNAKEQLQPKADRLSLRFQCFQATGSYEFMTCTFILTNNCSMAPQPSEADIIFNRANVALAKSQRLVASWLPPRTEDEIKNAKTEEETEKEEQELFTPMPELYVCGQHHSS